MAETANCQPPANCTGPTGNPQKIPILMLAILFLCGFIARLYKVTDPPLDYHPTRQYISANIARGIYLPGCKATPQWQKNVAKINGEAEMSLEPRYMETVVTGLYMLIGGEHLWLARALGALLWVLGAIPLFLLATRFLDVRWSLVSVVLYLFYPFAIMGSQVFQPEPLMVASMTLSLFLIWRAFDCPSWKRILIAAIISSFAISAKPVCIFFIVLAFAALAFAKDGILTSLRNPKYWTYGIVAVVPPVAYYLHHMLGATDLNSQSTRSFLPGLILTARYWFGWTDRLGRVVGLIPFAVGFVGILACKDRKKRYFLGSLYLAYLVYGLVFTHHIHTHDYYSLPIIPIVSITFPLGLFAGWSKLLNHWQRPFIRRAVLGVCIGVVVIGMAGIGGIALIKGPKKTCKVAFNYGGGLVGIHKKFVLFADPRRSAELAVTVRNLEEMGEALGHSINVACLTEDYGKSVFYHAQISGPFLFPNGNLDVLLDQCIAAQAQDYIILRLYDSPAKQEKLKKALLTHYPIAFEAGDCIAFDTRKREATNPH